MTEAGRHLLFVIVTVATIMTGAMAVTELINLSREHLDKLPYAATSVFFTGLTAIGIIWLIK